MKKAIYLLNGSEIEEAREIAASCWCHPSTEDRQMDPALAEVFALVIRGDRRLLSDCLDAFYEIGCLNAGMCDQKDICVVCASIDRINNHIREARI